MHILAEKGKTRTNLSSLEAHARRVRIARAKGMDKGFVEQLTKDLRKDIMGKLKDRFSVERCNTVNSNKTNKGSLPLLLSLSLFLVVFTLSVCRFRPPASSLR